MKTTITLREALSTTTSIRPHPTAAAALLSAWLAAGCATGTDELTAPSAAAVPQSFASTSLYGIHDLPSLDGPLPAWMGDGTQRIWATELAAWGGDSWDFFHFQGGCFDANTTCGTFRRIKRAYGDRVELIGRIDYRHGTGNSLPQNDAELADWKNLVTTRLFDSNDGTPISAFASTILVGNEVNLCVENGGDPQCAGFDRVARGRYLTTSPAQTARVYQQMRDHLRGQAARFGHTVNAMLEGSAPGGYGNERYLHFVLRELCNLNADVDAIAIHGYGGGNGTPAGADGTYGFSAAISQQLRGVDEACNGRYRHVPIVITEFSRGDNKLDADSNFIYDAYRWMNDWNAIPAHHGITGATYFHGRGNTFANENISLDTPNDHTTSRAAFGRAVAQRWPGRAGGNPSAAIPTDNECSLGGGTMTFGTIVPDRITGVFLDTWTNRGGLATFGYPISNARIETNSSGNTVCTQWFERQRIELRGTAIEFGRIGADRAEEDYPQIGAAWNAASPIASASCRFMNNHNICNGFKGLFEQTDVALVGLPLSEEFSYTDSHGTFTAQYFERARFEWHGNPADPNFGLQKGLLGDEAYQGSR